MTDMDPGRYYDRFGEGEWERLERDPVTRMEFENTVAALEEALPSAGRVLDAGGGAGRYAIWLADRGLTVDLLDLSGEQVRLAREHCAAADPVGPVTVQRGDLRRLPFRADAFDAVCCLGGPLSHVVSSEERSRALAELRRVSKPRATVAVSVIGRFAMLRDIMKFSLAENHGLLVPLARDGDYTASRVDRLGDGEGWAACHGFRVDEFESALEAAGFEIERLIGLENVANRMKAELSNVSHEALEDVRAVVKYLEADRTAVDFSEHMLAICRV